MNELIMAALTLLGPPALIGFLAIIASITPNKSDDKAIQMLLNLINKGGMNVGKAKNEEQP